MLSELGEEHIREMSLELFAYRELKDIVGAVEAVMGSKKENPFYPQFKYISATRALHELYVYEKMVP